MRYERLDSKTLREIEREFRNLKKGRVKTVSAKEAIRILNGRSRLKRYL